MDYQALPPLPRSTVMDVEEVPPSSSRYTGPTQMNVERTEVTLFQLPLSDRDIARFRTPISQGFASGRPMNCGAVSGSLLGILTSEETEHLTRQGIQAFSAQDANWADYLNTIINRTGFYQSRETTWTQVYDNLFENYGTIVGGSREDDVGHYFVIRRTGAGEVEALDPQSRSVYTGMSLIEGYIADQGFTRQPVAFFSEEPQTLKQINDSFIDYFLANQFAKCKLGGQRKRQTRRKKRHTRKMTRAKRKDERKPKSRNK